MTQHIFLSPHLDDAVLSCGGLLAALNATQATVAVFSVFTADPSPGQPFSSFAAYQHNRWGDLQQVYHTRRLEDQAALALVGVTPTWLNFPDAIYRGNPQTQTWWYHNEATLFGPIHPTDATIVAQVTQAIQTELNAISGPVRLYIPLTVGGHVDHRVVQQAALNLTDSAADIYFYEDYPYIQRNPQALDFALRQHPATAWQAEVVTFTPAQLQTKIETIAAYDSQMTQLFTDAATMARAVTDFAYTYNPALPGERLWYAQLT